MNSRYVLPGDPRRADLDAIQERIDALLTVRSEVEGSLRPLSEVRERFDKAMPTYCWLRSAAWRQQSDRTAQGPSNIFAEPLTLADLEWLFGRDKILDCIVSALESAPNDDRQSIGATEYSSQLAVTDRQLREMYVLEEQEVIRLFDQGIKATRRENSDVGVIFNTWNTKEQEHAQA